MALADGDRRQGGAVGHVADGVDRRHEGLRIAVDGDGADRVDRDADLFQPEPGRVGAASRCTRTWSTCTIEPSDSVAAMPSTVLSRRSTVRFSASVDATLGIGLAESVANVLVEAAQKLVAAMQERDLAAEPVEHARELHRDIAAADDQDPLRQGLEVEDLVRRDGEFAAGNRRLERRMGADRHQDDSGRGSALPVFTRRTVCGSSITRAAVDDLDAGLPRLAR